MRKTMSWGAAASALLLSAWAVSSAFAAPPAAQYSAKDIVDTFAKPAQPATQPPKGECEKRGMVTGEDGICEPVKNERGFSLPTRASMSAAGAKSAAAPAPSHMAVHTQIASANTHPMAPRIAPHRDLLITFKNGSAELTEQAQANAKAFSEALASPALASSRFEIAGYTNSVGASDKNMMLSQERAESVKSFLTAHGVDNSRIVAKGYGASDFAVPNSPTAAANRRVEARRVDN